MPGTSGHQEKFVQKIERVMRAMTHLNIGATLGLAAWIVCASLGGVGATHHEVHGTPEPKLAPTEVQP